MLSKEFVLAGKAIFTVTLNPELCGVDARTHRTYKIERVIFEGEGDKPDREFYFAYALTGSDNTSDYSYICRVDPKTGELVATAKSRSRVDQTRVWKVLKGALDLVWFELDVEGVEVQHAGSCGRCGRLLTEPLSLETGIGPVCRERMGA